MTPVETLFAVCRFLEKELKEFRFEDEDGRERGVAVYAFHLPEPPPTAMNPHKDGGHIPEPREQQGNAYEDLMPAVVIRPLKYEDKALADDMSVLSLSILAGVFSRDGQNVKGPWGVVNLLERIRQSLEMSPVLEGRCELLEPLSWDLYDEALRPLWFGEMVVQYRIAVPPKVSGDDWAGDFI